MARYKPYDVQQGEFIPLSFADQLLPGSFEHTRHELVEQPLDLSIFAQRYCNAKTGRLAYDPAVLRKIVLYGSYKGRVASRRLQEACRRNVVFMALSADTRPPCTTIADVGAQLGHESIALFCDVLLYCEALGLLGKEHLASDGCKLPSHASKQWSGTHKARKEQQEKCEKAAGKIVRRHRECDGRAPEGALSEPEQKKRERDRKKSEKIKAFLASTPKKVGLSGNEPKCMSPIRTARR